MQCVMHFFAYLSESWELIEAERGDPNAVDLVWINSDVCFLINKKDLNHIFGDL